MDKRSRGVEQETTWLKSRLWSERDLNFGSPDFKSSTLTTRPCCLQIISGSTAEVEGSKHAIDNFAKGSERERSLVTGSKPHLYTFMVNTSFISVQIPSKCLFTLLASLDRPSPDNLEILELIKAEKPLKPLVRK